MLSSLHLDERVATPLLIVVGSTDPSPVIHPFIPQPGIHKANCASPLFEFRRAHRCRSMHWMEQPFALLAMFTDKPSFSDIAHVPSIWRSVGWCLILWSLPRLQRWDPMAGFYLRPLSICSSLLFHRCFLRWFWSLLGLCVDLLMYRDLHIQVHEVCSSSWSFHSTCLMTIASILMSLRHLQPGHSSIHCRTQNCSIDSSIHLHHACPSTD